MKIGASLKVRLAVFLTLATLLPTLVVGIFSYNVLRQSLLDTAEDSAQNILETQIVNFDLTVSSIEMALSELVVAETTQAFIQLRKDRDSAAYYTNLLLVSSRLDSLISQRGDAIRTVAVLWNDGDTPLVRGDAPVLGLYGDYRQNFPFTQLDQTIAGTQWAMISNEQGERQIYLYRPLYSMSAGESIGVALFCFYPDFIESLLYTQSEIGAFSMLLEEAGGFLLAPTATEQSIMDTAGESIRTAGLLGESQGNRYVMIGNTSYLASYTTSSVNGWRFVSFNPLVNVQRSTKAITLVVMAVILASTAVATLSGVLLYRYINRPIQQLASAMQAFQQGTLTARVPLHRRDELGLLGNGFNHMADDTLQLIANIREKQETKRKIEIRFLQAQITPHFLYNTLNAAKALARLGRNEEIVDMMTSLISLLRLTSNGDSIITVGQEIAYLQNYLEVMQYRKGQQYTLLLQLGEAEKRCLIPKFTLQPIVENSIIHGFIGREDEPCSLWIDAHIEADVLTITVRDNGIGFDPVQINVVHDGDDVRFSKVGTDNVNERIKLYFGNSYGMTVCSELGHGTITTICIPAQQTLPELPIS